MANDLMIKDEFTNDADLAALGEAAHDLTEGDMVGGATQIQRRRVAEEEHHRLPQGHTQLFIVDIRSYKHGWIRWEDKKPTHRHVGRKVDGFPLPVRSRLPEPGLEGRADDPWQETHSIVMRDLGADDAPTPPQNGLCTYTTTSWGGRKALGRLIDQYVNQAKQYPGMMPVVYLGSFEKPNTRGGMTDNPLFTIVEWKPFGPGASPPGRRPDNTPVVPQITHSGDGDDKPVHVMSNGKEVFFKDGLDDEIPF